MILNKILLTNCVGDALREIGIQISDSERLKRTTIAVVTEHLQDVGGTSWDPSPDLIAGVIVLTLFRKKNYTPGFDGVWFADHADATIGDLIDHLHKNQVSLD